MLSDPAEGDDTVLVRYAGRQGCIEEGMMQSD